MKKTTSNVLSVLLLINDYCTVNIYPSLVLLLLVIYILIFRRPMERNYRIIFINSSVPAKYHSCRLLYNVHGSLVYIYVCTVNAVHLNNHLMKILYLKYMHFWRRIVLISLVWRINLNGWIGLPTKDETVKTS